MNIPAKYWHLLRTVRFLKWRLLDLIGKDKRRVREPTRVQTPVRIGFLVCEKNKWALQTLFETLNADADFTCGFYLNVSDLGLRQSADERRRYFEQQRSHFAALGSVWGSLYDPDRDRLTNPGQIECDLLFIQQPWGMSDMPRRLFPHIPCAYVHYGLATIENNEMQAGLRDFHRWLWAYFVPAEIHATLYRDALLVGERQPNIVVSGHPRLEAILAGARRKPIECGDRKPMAKRVLVAPHHALAPGTLRLATFDWSGRILLDLAQYHPQIEFVLRPHPNFEFGIRKAGSGAFLDEFLAQWESLPNTSINKEGDYVALFHRVDAMITDSGSFLAEFLPTGKPILRLVNADGAPLNCFGESLAGAFYTIGSPEDLLERFSEVIVQGNDPCEITRGTILEDLMGQGGKSPSQSIRACLRDAFKLSRTDP